MKPYIYIEYSCNWEIQFFLYRPQPYIKTEDNSVVETLR